MAFPELSSVSVPSTVVPSLKVTVPVGGPGEEAGVTVAVKVTACPCTDGFCDDVTVVVVFSLKGERTRVVSLATLGRFGSVAIVETVA